MKLIRKAKIKKTINKIECDHCEAVYACEKRELEFVADQRDGDFYWFKCPGCKGKSAIAEEFIK
jgi:hypothetical protein